MTPEQVTLVQESLLRVEPISDQADVMFYGNRLLRKAPR